MKTLTKYILSKEMFFAFIITLVISLAFFYFKPVQEKPLQAPAITPSVIPTPVLEIIYEGKVSYYSHDGCIGCSPNQIMGNGLPFDENAMTIAVPCEDIINGRVQYGETVQITNTETGKWVIAEITDCGGFRKLNRVADLSKELARVLEVKTDITTIKIEK